MPTLRTEYLRVPEPKTPEFWDPERIAHLRALAVTGKATEAWSHHRQGGRALDRLGFKRLDEGTPLPPARADTTTALADGQIPLSVPLYFGDMSYGSLAGVPNVALARAADRTGTLTGTGEGGLHPDVARCQNITVQWASARFGVTPATLKRGKAIVIKVGQGAKPGVGGHLPASKVTDVIRRTRRIPTGRDAISPAPHHDIYSIEDLGQRIAALKHLTGLPVFVKVAATNYAPYIACGIARMDGDGIILDGAGAGTGASPTVMKDHVGLPIEYAVAGVDRMLRQERLRDGFSVIAAGTVSSALDAARLTALGADCISIGTASLVAMGCIMVHKCHLGGCPALLTTPAEDEPARATDIDWITDLQVNLVNGWADELGAIVASLGLASVRDLVGRRDLLTAIGPMEPEAARLFGVDPERLPTADPVPLDRHRKWTRELAGVSGKHAGQAQIGSMGSTAAPFAEVPARITDHLRLDGAQVTRPAIDSYRELVRTRLRLLDGTLLEAPIMLGIGGVGPARALGLLGPDAPVVRVPSSRAALDGLPAGIVVVDESDPSSDLALEIFIAEADRAGGPDAPDLIAAPHTLQSAGDVAKFVALGAAAVDVTPLIDQVVDGLHGAEADAVVEDLAFGIIRELRLLLGAAGCTSMITLRGNRELLRAVDLEPEVRRSLGVKPAGWG